ncbi:MAG: hypothetical protein ACTSQY_02875 [Candidatus Odinarchaeia archaeon]
MAAGMFRGIYHPKKGLVVKARYPTTLKVDPYILTKIFSVHIKKNGLNTSRILIEEQDRVFISFFSGEPARIITGLILTKEEDWSRITNIFDREPKEQLEEFDLKILVESLIKSHKIDREQHLYFYLTHPLRREILEIMHEEYVVDEKEIYDKLKTKNFPRQEVKAMISSMVNEEVLLRYETNKRKYLILIKDFIIYRTYPPKTILNRSIEKLTLQNRIEYFSDIKSFFEMYDAAFPNEIDREVILNIIKDISLYNIINSLRENILTEKKLVQRISRYEEDIQDKIESLKSAGFIKEIEQGNKKLFLLKTNPQIKEIFPMYTLTKIIEIIKDEKELKEIENKILTAKNAKYG